jgi:hypothetical protein
MLKDFFRYQHLSGGDSDEENGLLHSINAKRSSKDINGNPL